MTYRTTCRLCFSVCFVRGVVNCPNCKAPMILYDKHMREIPNNDILDRYMRGETYMPELGVKVKSLPDQAKEAGTYEILQGAYVPQQTRQGRAIILNVRKIGVDGKPTGNALSLFVPYYDEPTSRTNLAMLIAAWTTNTDKWIGKRVKLVKDEAGKAKLSAA